MSLEDFKKKQTIRLSNTTVMRFKEPTSKLSRFYTQFIADYSKSQPAIPDNNPKILMEATSGRDRKFMPINKSGKSPVFGPLGKAFIGSSEDDPGNF